MKYIVILNLLFLNTLLYGQQLKDFEEQAIEHESKNNYFEALRLYNFIKLKDSLGTSGNKASDKIETLLPLVINELNGTWELKQKRNRETIINFTDVLEIKNGKATFIKISDKKEEVIESRKLDFISYSPSFRLEFPKIKLSNGEVWVLSFRTINNERRLIWTQKVTSSGAFVGIIDDRGIIIDPVKRKKAMEGEILTYYVLKN